MLSCLVLPRHGFCFFLFSLSINLVESFILSAIGFILQPHDTFTVRIIVFNSGRAGAYEHVMQNQVSTKRQSEKDLQGGKFFSSLTLPNKYICPNLFCQKHCDFKLHEVFPTLEENKMSEP